MKKFLLLNENEFIEKERKRERRQCYRMKLAQLDNWKPAERVSSAFKVFDLDPNDKNGGKYRPRVR